MLPPLDLMFTTAVRGHLAPFAFAPMPIRPEPIPDTEWVKPEPVVTKSQLSDVDAVQEQSADVVISRLLGVANPPSETKTDEDDTATVQPRDAGGGGGTKHVGAIPPPSICEKTFCIASA